jgi:hypothetical protein
MGFKLLIMGIFALIFIHKLEVVHGIEETSFGPGMYFYFHAPIPPSDYRIS